MSLNWGEINKGDYENDKKVGAWEKMTNNGYCILTENNVTKVTFPYVNQDYYEGKVDYKRESYQLTFINGKYFSIQKDRVVDEKKLVNVINFQL